MKIIVTQDDIDKGESCNPFTCPIALAAKRVFPGKELRVNLTFLVIQDSHRQIRYRLPDEAKKFIDRHDSNENAPPFEFEV